MTQCCFFNYCPQVCTVTILGLLYKLPVTIVAQLHHLQMTIVAQLLHQLPLRFMRHLHHPPTRIHRNGAILTFSNGGDSNDTCHSRSY